MPVCSYCGRKSGQDSPWCQACGTDLTRSPSTVSAKVQRLTAFTLLAAVGAWFIACAYHVRHIHAEFDHIPIRGTRDFTVNVAAALKVLKARSPEGYSTVTNYIGRFVQSSHTGMDVWENPPTSYLHDRFPWQSVEAYAAGIAHESFHSKLLHDFLNRTNMMALVPEYGNRMNKLMKLSPIEVWTGETAEKLCCEYQNKVLKEIGGTPEEVAWCTWNPSNRYWEIPYEKRNW